MSLLTYEDARPWARAIREEVSEGHMPPWHADAPDGTFDNERRLTDAEKETLVRWANGGAPKGDPKDMPPAPTFADGWPIGKPDVDLRDGRGLQGAGRRHGQLRVLLHPDEFHGAEVGAGDRSAARRSRGRAPRARLLPRQARHAADAGAAVQPGAGELARADTWRSPAPDDPSIPGRLLATYAPGTNPQVFPAGTALRLEAGGILELQMHYTTNGTAATDRTRVGMIFSKEPAPREIRVGDSS